MTPYAFTSRNGMRVCRRCRQNLPLERFWDGYKWCKGCHNAYSRTRHRKAVLATPAIPSPHTGRISPLRGRWRV